MRRLTFFWGFALIGIGAAIIGFLVDKNYSYENVLFVKESNVIRPNKYGTIIVPILESCPVTFTEDDSNIIDKVEIYKFSKSILGLFGKEYIVIEHSGGPSDAINFVNEQMKGCWPNLKAVYDTSVSLSGALEDIIVRSDISFSRPVYMKITKGKIEAFYKKEDLD